MKVIVCTDNNWGIGKNNQLLYHIPDDMKFFKEKTVGNVVIMGLNTLLSLPDGKPLRDRVNIVLCNDDSFECEGIVKVSSVDDLFETLDRFKEENIYVIGGASVYEQLLPYCDTAYVTKVSPCETADRFFPNLDEDENWTCIRKSDEIAYKDKKYMFMTYKNIQD